MSVPPTMWNSTPAAPGRGLRQIADANQRHDRQVQRRCGGDASSDGPSLKPVRSLLAIAHWQVMDDLPEGRTWLGICIFAGGIFVVESGDQCLTWRSLGSLKGQPNLMWTGVGDSFWVRTDWWVSTFLKPGNCQPQ